MSVNRPNSGGTTQCCLTAHVTFLSSFGTGSGLVRVEKKKRDDVLPAKWVKLRKTLRPEAVRDREMPRLG